MNRYLVIGLGATGLSIIDFLQKDTNNEIFVFDTRADFDATLIKTKYPNIHYYLGGIPLEILDNIDEIIASPGIDLNIPVVSAARKLNIPILGDIELFYRYAKAPIIGITGTNAKSTVTTMVTEMINATGAQAQIGGNIGLHVLKLLGMPVPDYYVLELSSFQLELTDKLSCLVAVVLNVSPNHLDRHGSMEVYQEIKEKLYLNAEHPIYFRGLKYFKAPTGASFSFDNDEPLGTHDFGVRSHHGERYVARGESLLMPVKDLSAGLPGEHNLINALSALAIVAPLKLPLEPQLEVLKKFKGLPHRSVLIRTLNGVRWINDSKGTTIGATAAGIKGLAGQSGRLILILGGVGKQQDFSLLRPAVAQYVAHTIIFGKDKALINEALSGLSIEMVDDLDQVIARAHAVSKAGDVVLFSPACASYDMFKHFEERGEVFTKKVNAL